tara:strand:- start:937 stop:2388 length:1452 start_codon:yes stop_codon:yes gene_type:complete
MISLSNIKSSQYYISSDDKKHLPIRLLPHQKHLVSRISDDLFPIYICWGMGSGKTIGACMCMSILPEYSKVLIICDKSTVLQWKSEVQKLLIKNHTNFNALHIDLIHYEYLEQENAPDPSKYSMTIVDESHRFRNAWSRESHRMLNWMFNIQKCKRVIYLSGTPIVHNAADERKAFDNMMFAEKKDLKGRIFFYDPRYDPKSEKKYPKKSEENIECPMSWSQCFLYLLNRRQDFTIKIENEDEPRTRMSSSKNTYNTLLRAFSNNPFPKNPALSPKFQQILKQLEACNNNNCKQIIYSSRKDTGVKALQSLWNSLNNKTSFQITGDMTHTERDDNIKKFNRKPNSTLFITDAGAQGIDLKRVDIVHIMEPAENIQDENQIINRAIRYKSHSSPDSTVQVFRYITIFPKDGSVNAPWKKVLYDSGMFHKDEMKGITRKVQYALRKIIHEEESNESIDQKVLRVRSDREVEVQNAMLDLKCFMSE